MPTPDQVHPEAGWERRTEFVQVSAVTAAQLLQPLLGACTIASLVPLTEGRANSNYRIQVAGAAEPVVLRLYVRDRGACAREAALNRLVRDSVPVPEFLYADPSPTWFPHPYAVMRWVDGVSLAAALASEPAAVALPIGSAVGQTLAAIGAYQYPRPEYFGQDPAIVPPQATSESFFGYIKECLFTGGAAAHLGEPLASDVWEFVQRNADYLEAGNGPTALVHGDYKSGNLLLRRVDAGWAVAAVLDWEFAFAGPPVFDLAILLRHAAQFPPQFEHGVCGGFTAGGGRLPNAWKRRSLLLDFANLCGFLTWSGRGSALITDVKRLLRQTMTNWESYPA